MVSHNDIMPTKLSTAEKKKDYRTKSLASGPLERAIRYAHIFDEDIWDSVR